MSNLSDAGARDDVEVAQSALGNLTSALERILGAQAEAQQKIEDLTAELNAWKSYNRDYRAENESLKSRLNAYTSNPFAVALLDGDGYKFSRDLIVKGHEGGRDAARHLHAVLKSYLEAHTLEDISQIIVYIYFDRLSLESYLQRANDIDPKVFVQFCRGFNEAAPLWATIDCGTTKESADTKLKENMLLYARMPQCSRLFFAGMHDKSYLLTLSTLSTSGHQHKIVLMKPPFSISPEFQALESSGYKQLSLSKDLISDNTVVRTMSPLARAMSPETPKRPTFSSQVSQPKKAEVVVTTYSQHVRSTNGSANVPSPTSEPEPEQDDSSDYSDRLPPRASAGRDTSKYPCKFHFLYNDCKSGRKCGYSHEITKEDDKLYLRLQKTLDVAEEHRDHPRNKYLPLLRAVMLARAEAKPGKPVRQQVFYNMNFKWQALGFDNFDTYFAAAESVGLVRTLPNSARVSQCEVVILDKGLAMV